MTIIASLESSPFISEQLFDLTSSFSSDRNAVKELRTTMKKGKRMQKIIQISSILMYAVAGRELDTPRKLKQNVLKK